LQYFGCEDLDIGPCRHGKGKMQIGEKEKFDRFHRPEIQEKFARCGVGLELIL
jgi:hypothetical protein